MYGDIYSYINSYDKLRAILKYCSVIVSTYFTKVLLAKWCNGVRKKCPS